MFSKIIIQGTTIRIAAVAAFLACSLLGRPLHEFQHHAGLLADAEDSAHSFAEASCTKSKTSRGKHKCEGGPHSREVTTARSGEPVHSHGSGTHSPEPCGDHPGHSHDSHDCSICQALCVSATAPCGALPCLRPDVCVGQHSILSESAAASALHAADARGPPGLG